VKLAGIAAVLSLVLAGAGFAQQPNPDPRLADARAKIAAGDADGALAAVEVAVAQHPDLPPAQLVFAGLLFQNRQPAAGRAVMERAAVERPDHPEVYAAFGRLAIAEGRLLDAALCFERGVSLASSDRWPAPQKRLWLNSAHAGAAAVAERRKDWKGAYASLMVLAELNPADAVTRWRLGRASFFIDKHDQAEELFRSAFKEDPRIGSAETSLGNLWLEKGDDAKAEPYFTKAVTEHPTDARARHAMTRFLIHSGRGEAARQSAAKGLSMQPKETDARLLAILASRQVGDVTAAEAIVENWLADSPQNPFALAQSAQLNALSKERSKKDLARERANAAVKAQQGRGDSQTTLGVVQYLLDDPEAEKTLRGALLSGDANAETAFYLAMLLERKGDKEGAIRLYSRALEAPGLFIFRVEAENRRKKLKATAAAQTKP
jgi:tetratricopeptide (TPR) repeat protein